MTKRLYKVDHDKKLMGVCGGLAEYLNIDPTVIRIAWIIFTLISVGTGILIYVICEESIIPKKPNGLRQ